MSADLVTWLARLQELSESAVGRRPVPEALHLVAATARELLSLDFCGVLVPNDEGSALVIAGWDGLSDAYVDRINRTNPVGLGSTAPSSRAYFGGAPVSVGDIAAERGFAPWGGVAHEQGYRSMISVPLRSEQGVLGTLNGYHASEHRYSDDEVTRMTLLANHAAAALTAAERVDQLRRSNETLVRQRDLLERGDAIRSQLLAASLGERGTAAVVESLERIIRHPVRFQPVTDGASDANGADAGFRRYPVELEGETAGILAVGTDGRGELDGIDEIAVGHAVAVLGLELLRQRTAQETEYRIAGELLQDVMTAGLSEQSIVRARGLGFDLPDLRVATVITVGDADRPDASPRRRAHLRARLGRLRLPGAGGDAAPLVAELRERTVALWPASVAKGATTRIRESLQGAFPDAAVVVAASGLRATPVEAVRVALTVHGVVAAAGSRGGAFEPPDLGYVGALLHVPDPAVLTALVERQLGAVLEYDRRRGSALVPTLAAWLDHGCDRARTAAALRLHPNTVQQRLRRVEALAGVELSVPRDLLAVTAAVELLALTHASA